MENKEMLNSIDVSMFDENEVVSLLLKVVELSNGKATLLNKKIEEYNLIQKKFEEDNSSLKKQVESLTENEIKASQLRELLNNDLAKANNKIATQESTIEELSKKITSLSSELSEANISAQKKEESISNLLKDNERLQSELSAKTALLDSQNETIQELTDKNNSLNDSLNDAYNIIDENKIRVVKIYANMISDLLALRKSENSHWDKYLADICQKIGKFIEEATNIEILTFSLKSSNSWLTRIATIIWWSKQTTISNVVNNNVSNVNELNKVFDNLIQYLIDIDIMIQLPNCDFCDVIDNYEANLKEKSNFNDLFDKSEIPEGTLCEIYKLAINGSKGLCLTYNS